MKIDLTNGKFVWGKADKTFDIIFAGDLCPRGSTEELVLAGKSREILADVMPELAHKDLAAINLEAPLTKADTPIRKSGPNLKVDPGCIDLIRAGGWDVACCANNHIGDFGQEAVRETLNTLKHNGIVSVGAGKNLAAARQPAFIEKNGLRIAWLAVAENEFGIAGEKTAGGNPLQPIQNINQIKAAAAQADITIVMIHGGNEFNPVPSPRMVDTYRAFADAGASAVVAGHTHCPQGVEIRNGVPIIYSLSNFLFDWDGFHGNDYNWWYGYMVRIGFDAGHAVKLEIIPHHCSPHGEKVTLLHGEERARFLTYLNFLSRIITDEKEVKKYFDAWCVAGIDGHYFTTLSKPFYPVDWDSPETIGKFMNMRNLHTCEAHSEMITNILRIIEERRETEAAEYCSRLEHLRNGKIPDTNEINALINAQT